MPFYYIDYTLAQTCAFQFWINSEQNKEQSWENYMRLCKAGGSLSFTKLIDLAKLDSPFKDRCLEKVVGYVEGWLKSVDVRNI